MTGSLVTPAQRVDIEQFVYAEARLLDERRFVDWLACFDDDGWYWVPGRPDETSPLAGVSLFYEHKPLLAVRIARLSEPSLHAYQPPVRTHHQVSAVQITAEEGVLIARSGLIVAESRRDEPRWFAGRVLHRLRYRDGKLRIASKRVDLINCDAPHRALIVPF